MVEITREVKILKGKDQGKESIERVLYISSREFEPQHALKLLHTVRAYWEIESGLHQRLDVTAREDASRVRNRNSLLVLGIVRRSMMGIYRDWQRGRANQRQSTLSDFYDAMNKFNGRQGWQKLHPRPK